MRHLDSETPALAGLTARARYVELKAEEGAAATGHKHQAVAFTLLSFSWEDSR